MENSVELKEYVGSLSQELQAACTIDESSYDSMIKRGLRNVDGSGVYVGISRIGSVQGYHIEDGAVVPQPGRLYYRGYEIQEIVNAHRAENTFGYEEVAQLLLCGKLPTAEEADRFGQVLSKLKPLPAGFYENEIIKSISPNMNMMNSIQRCILALYAYDDNPDDTSIENVLMQSIGLVARMPTLVAQLYATKRHYFNSESLYIHNPKEKLSVAENFLRLIRQDKSFTDKEAKLLDTLLILHAEHSGGNNSAFTCRAVSSTNTDTYSAIAAAVGSLKGPLHGGANAAVMKMVGDIREHVSDIHDDDEVGAYLDKILAKEAGDGTGILYGLGHAVYTMSDPRTTLIKSFIRDVSEGAELPDEFIIADCVERLGIPKLMAKKHLTMPMCANVDLYSGIVYSMLGIPADLYTPLFAVARISGWCAHRLEELACHRLMRPAYRSAAVKSPYVPIADR